MGKKSEKKRTPLEKTQESMSIDQKLAVLKVACVVGAGIIASLALWWFSK